MMDRSMGDWSLAFLPPFHPTPHGVTRVGVKSQLNSEIDSIELLDFYKANLSEANLALSNPGAFLS